MKRMLTFLLAFVGCFACLQQQQLQNFGVQAGEVADSLRSLSTGQLHQSDREAQYRAITQLHRREEELQGVILTAIASKTSHEILPDHWNVSQPSNFCFT